MDKFVDSQAAVKSRRAYTLECLFEYLVALLVSDSFLAALLSYMGIGEGAIGVITSLISLAFLFEIFAIFIVRKIQNVKRFCVIFHSVSQLLFLSLYLIPLFPIFDGFRPAAVTVCIILAYFGNYFVTSLIYRWGNSYVDPGKRAVFNATKEIISLAAGILSTVALGYVMQRFKDLDNMSGWMLFAAASILIFSLCDLICLLSIKNGINGERSEDKVHTPFREVLSATFGNKKYVNLVILSSLWYIGYYTVIGFMGTFKNALFPLAAVQIINAAANIIRILVSRPIGRFSDKTSYANGIALGIGVSIIGFAVNIFSSDAMRWPLIVCVILCSVGSAGIGQNMLTISISYVDNRFFVEANAIKSSISGICGFLAALASSRLVDTINANGNVFLGIKVYPQQVLSAIAVIFMIIAFLFDIFAVSKQKTLQNGK